LDRCPEETGPLITFSLSLSLLPKIFNQHDIAGECAACKRKLFAVMRPTISPNTILFEVRRSVLTASSDAPCSEIRAPSNLMDAASCFILTSMLVSIEVGHPSNLEARQLLEDGYAHKQEMPRTLFISSELATNNLALEALRIDTSADPVCETANPDQTIDWVVVTDHKLANVVVYLRGESNNRKPS